jgi:hypothetical protein
MSESPFETVEHDVDFCVVGGGMAGMFAAVAAARHGARVALVQDRPVLGGNASSEIRMHICGADRHNRFANLRETGLLEELRLENCARNAQQSFRIRDMLFYELTRYQPGLALLLNCSVTTAGMDGKRIISVTGWQTTTQQYHHVRAKLFADCSGDAILAPLTGADFRIGREGRQEYGESIAPPEADRKTMGMTCLFQASEYDEPRPFIAPHWANRYDRCDQLPYGADGHKRFKAGYWWLELGGEYDSIADTEELRDELLRILYGAWDHIKNRCVHSEAAANWALDWVGVLPGKRESRRYLGPHVLTQHDLEAEGRFDDVVAYGGWSMDDHHPGGFAAAVRGEKATIFHPCPSPYGIPYRSLYSRNIENLYFAGRNISATHAAMSSTRVMGTCGAIGQAVGTAAAMAVEMELSPAGVGEHISELQQRLLRDDCYLPWVVQEFSKPTREAKLTASADGVGALRDGVSRPVGDQTHAWGCGVGDWAMYEFEAPVDAHEVTIVVDSALSRDIEMSPMVGNPPEMKVPDVVVRELDLETRIDGEWKTLHSVRGNYRRQLRLAVNKRVEAVRVRVGRIWGAERTRLYAFYVE